MQGIRASCLVAFATVAAASVVGVVVGACGGTQVTADGRPREAGEDDVDTSPDADAAADAAADWWTGCPKKPVVCPDADYYITINGDGPEQTLRSNVWEQTWIPPPGYHIPIATYQPRGENPANHRIWASDTPDGGKRIEISPEHYPGVYYQRDGKLYGSYAMGETPKVAFTQA